MFLNIEIWLSLLTILAALIMIFYKKAFNYWKNKNVSYFQPSFPFGNIENPFFTRKGQNIICMLYYEKFKKQKKQFGGIFLATTPVLIPIDPELVKCILVKDFQHFTSHGMHIDEKVDPVFNHLFAMNEPQWKPMRTKLTPLFSSGKMKIMFEIMLGVGKLLKSHVDENVDTNELLDIKEISSCYTTDVIGSCVFGVESNSLKNPEAEFRRMGKKFLTPSALFILKRYFLNNIPFIKVPILDRDIASFFMNTLKTVVNYREENNCRRDDFIQILLDMRQKEKDEGRGTFTFEQMVAQAFVFFIAGFESSSSTLTFCLHEISHNQIIQEKLRSEIMFVLEKNDGELTYEGLAEMKYMSQETLRKYPPVSIVPRECTIDYKIPGHDVTIEKGTHIWISAFGLQRDPEYYPEPETFDPERFTEENKNNRHPFTFVPFGEGPRVCIGLRFGLMQIKIGLSILLKHFRFSPVRNGPYKLHFHPNMVFTSPKEHILLQATRI